MRILMILILASFISRIALAQVDVENGSNVSIEVQKASFDYGDDLTFVTSVINIKGQYAFNEKYAIYGEIPTAHFGTDNDNWENESTVGNPYLGFNIYNTDRNQVTSLGVRFPLSSKNKGDAASVGYFSDLNNYESFYPKLASASIKTLFVNKKADVFFTRFGFGIMGQYNTDVDEYDDELEALLDYRAGGGINLEKFSMGIDFLGRCMITEKGNFGERTIHQLKFTATGKINNYEPYFFLRAPLEDDSDAFLDHAYGIGLKYNFN